VENDSCVIVNDGQCVRINDVVLRIVSINTNPKNGYVVILAKPENKKYSSEVLRDVITETRYDSIKNQVFTDKIEKAILSFIDTRKKQFPNFTVVKNAKVEDGITQISKLLKKGFDEDVIIACIRIAEDHDFWKRNLMTLSQLNKKCKDDLTKFEHLLMIYEDEKPNSNTGKRRNNNPGFQYEDL